MLPLLVAKIHIESNLFPVSSAAVRKGGKPQPQRIAAGLTGMSSATHYYISHGFDMKIFGARSREHGLGGIWSVCLPADGHSLSVVAYGLSPEIWSQ